MGIQSLDERLFHAYSRVPTILRTQIHSLHTGSTVDANDLSVDPLAVLGRKEAHDAGNVDRETNTVKGRPGSGVL